MTAAANEHPHLVELIALLGREDFVDFGVGGVDLRSDLRLNAAHERVDAGVVLIDDALDSRLLLRCQIQLAIEMFHDPPRDELPEWRPPSVKKIEVIARDSDEHAADERRDDHQGSRRPRLTR